MQLHGTACLSATHRERKPRMSLSDVLLTRIRAEYREMPGLCLTFAQACRLWQLDSATCERVLHALVAEHFLGRTTNGRFMALPTPRRLPDIRRNVVIEPTEAAASCIRQSA
jgi:hypothetical protein